MTAAAARAGDDDAGTSPEASIRAARDLEVPRPLRLLLTAAWSLTESAGLPVAAYALAAWADGREGSQSARVTTGQPAAEGKGRTPVAEDG